MESCAQGNAYVCAAPVPPEPVIPGPLLVEDILRIGCAFPRRDARFRPAVMLHSRGGL